MKNFNNEIKSVKGISIIALVITIVVLIILAGVAINMTIRQNGVLTKAKLSQQKYQNSQKEEESILENMTDDDIKVKGKIESVDIERTID